MKNKEIPNVLSIKEHGLANGQEKKKEKKQNNIYI
jgi:hypothetical protein